MYETPERNICLQHACIYNIQNYFCNIQIKHLQQTSRTDKTFETYMYNHYNMGNITIYFCNINIQHCIIAQKHLKHLKHTIILQHALLLG
jgi:hypothetical protein